jgi:hypothetical protein
MKTGALLIWEIDMFYLLANLHRKGDHHNNLHRDIGVMDRDSLLKNHFAFQNSLRKDRGL